MRLVCRHTIGDLSADMTRIATQAKPDMMAVARKNAYEGNRVAREEAVRTSRKHAKLYPGSFSVEGNAESTASFSYVYGPTKGGQGSLAPILENGSINNPPHNNLDHSVDIIRPKFAADIRDMIGDWFW